MAKEHYVCSNCDERYTKWFGQCPKCKSYNTLQETQAPIETVAKNRISQRQQGFSVLSQKVQRLSDVNNQSLRTTLTDWVGLDNLLSGEKGLVSGSVTLLGGDPGIGKSTLLLQLSDVFAKKNKKVLYISGEESDGQIKLRAMRLNCQLENILVGNMSELEAILAAIEQEKPDFLVIDSIQALYSSQLSGTPASPSQIKECATMITQIAKREHIDTFLIGHVTKSGDVAGPQLLEHLVDTVLFFEGEKDSNFRTLRAHKNRYGSTHEMVIFEMTEDGLQEIIDPSCIFLENNQHENEIGSVVLATQYNQTQSAMLIEVQSLLAENQSGHGKRIANGVEFNRLSMILGIIGNMSKFKFYDYDVFVNVVQGFKIQDTASDLAIFLSIISSIQVKPLRNKLAVFGEISLNGRLRLTRNFENRISVAEKTGYQVMILPELKPEILKKMQKSYPKIKLIPCSHVRDVIQHCFS